MSKPKGAWLDAVEYTVNKDMEAKSDLLQKMIDEPDKYPWPAGISPFELIFGDYMEFVKKMEKLRG